MNYVRKNENVVISIEKKNNTFQKIIQHIGKEETLRAIYLLRTKCEYTKTVARQLLRLFLNINSMSDETAKTICRELRSKLNEYKTVVILKSMYLFCIYTAVIYSGSGPSNLIRR